MPNMKSSGNVGYKTGKRKGGTYTQMAKSKAKVKGSAKAAFGVHDIQPLDGRQHVSKRKTVKSPS